MSQKQNTKIKAVSSSNSRKADPLAKYRKQARTFIDLYFGASTPDFVHDLLSEWYSQLENETQVFWNDRRIAEIAVPLMLKKAADMGIDAAATCSDFMFDTVDAWRDSVLHKTDYYGDDKEHTRKPTEDEILQAELEKDAEAIARITHSPHIPTSFKNRFTEAVTEITNQASDAPEVIRAQWPLAITRVMKEEQKGDSAQ